jgi:hypothetical protein
LAYLDQCSDSDDCDQKVVNGSGSRQSKQLSTQDESASDSEKDGLTQPATTFIGHSDH